MTLHVDVAERGEMVAVGNAMAAFIDAKKRKGPWFVAVEGPFECGKSLIPLAIDQYLRPETDQNGIETSKSADDLISGPVVFRNAFYMQSSRGFTVDDVLQKFQESTPGADVYITSNIIKNSGPDNTLRLNMFNSAALGEKSDILDAMIYINWTTHPEKLVSIALRDAPSEEMLHTFLPQARLG